MKCKKLSNFYADKNSGIYPHENFGANSYFQFALIPTVSNTPNTFNLEDILKNEKLLSKFPIKVWYRASGNLTNGNYYYSCSDSQKTPKYILFFQPKIIKPGLPSVKIVRPDNTTSITTGNVCIAGY